jgi:PAS domain S-box-containing protein
MVTTGDTKNRSGKWITAGFIAVIIFFLVSGITVVESVYSSLDDTAKAGEASTTQKSLSDLVSALKDIQRGVRGYVITGDTSFLGPYRTGLGETAIALRAVTAEVPADKETARRLDMIQSFSVTLISSMKRQVDLVDRHRSDSARTMVQVGEATRALEAVDNVVQQMIDEENRAEVERNAEAQAHLRDSIGGIIGTRAFFLVLLIVIFIVMKRQLRERNRLAAIATRSEQRLQTVVNSIREGVTFSNSEGRFEIFNPRMQELTGYTREEANRSGDFSRLIYPDPADRQRALDGLKTLMEHKEPHSTETTITTKNGARRLLRISSQVIGGIPNRMFLSTYQDITEERRLEEGMRGSERRYRLMFETSPIPALVYNDDTLAILAVSDVTLSHYGYSREEFLSMTIKDIRPEEDIPDLLMHLATTKEDVRHSGIWRHRKKDGTIMTVDVRSHAIPWEGHQARLVMIHDITEHQRIEEELRIQKTYFERLFNAMPEGVALIDESGCIRNVNKAYEHIFGFTREEVLGRNVTTLNVPVEYVAEVHDSLEAVMNGVGISLETHRLRKDGSVIDLSIIATPVDLGGDQRMVYGIYRDITQRKKSEKEREELIEQLQKAIAEVKTLSGLLPVCAWCKKVRDDKGYYHQLETYIAAHSGATFTHGICPDCLETMNAEAASTLRRKNGEHHHDGVGAV